jgi:hypothetical protein
MMVIAIPSLTSTYITCSFQHDRPQRGEYQRESVFMP